MNGGHPRSLAGFIGLALILACAPLLSARAQGTGARGLTSLLTESERQAAGLSKLSSDELRALDDALLRVMALMSLGVATPPDSRSGTAALDELSFYDQRGRATAYLDPGRDMVIYLWTGEPVAYLDDESVYGFNGKHLGWYRNGRIYDHDGDIVVAPAGNGQPVQPAPPRAPRGLRPLRGLKELRPLRPLWGLSWSSTPARVFFLAGV